MTTFGRRSLLLVTILLLSAAACPRAPKAPSPTPAPTTEPSAEVTLPAPSRAPYAGCVWQPFVSRPAGVALLVQECGEGHGWVFTADAGGVYQTGRTPPGSSSIGPVKKIIEMYTKPAAQDVTAAVTDRFVRTLPQAAQRTGCVVQPTNRMRLGPGKQAFVIAPDAGYAAEAQAMQQAGPGARPCGDHGLADAVWYFEYHPAESQTRYLFVVVGQDAPTFDEQSIRLLGG